MTKICCRTSITISIVFLLASCFGDHFRVPNLVQHRTVLPDAPDVDCIWNRLFEISKPRKVLTIRDEILDGVNHRFHLDAEQQPFSVSIFFADDGSHRYSSASYAPNGTLADCLAAQQTLVEVDAALSGQCGLGDITGAVQESRVGTICDQLSDMSN